MGKKPGSLNRFMPNGISHRYQLEQSISVLMDAGWWFSFLLKNILLANSGDPGQTPRSVASDLGLHFLPASHKRRLGLYGLAWCRISKNSMFKVR